MGIINTRLYLETEDYMNKFYNEICKYYEDIFPKNEAQLNFLKSISEGKDNIEIGCATGLVSKNL